MYIKLIRNKPQGHAITGRLIIDGTFFCDTLERKGYQILPLYYHVAVTQSPKFKRLLPIVQNVPQRSGIRFHRGSKPEHSTGCILVVADNKHKGTINNNLNVREAIVRPKGDKNINQQHSAGERAIEDRSSRLARLEHTPAVRSDVSNPVGCRSAAEIERELTSLILKAQQDHEEIILEITDYRVGTDYGYNHPCPPELQQHAIDARRAAQRYNELCRTERHA